jgi:carboxyl-terminal processing protease
MKLLFQKYKNILALILLCIIFFGVGYFVNVLLTQDKQTITNGKETVFEEVSRPKSIPDNLRSFWEAYSFINDSYFDKEKINNEKITDDTITSLIRSLDDKHSTYITPEQWKISSSDLTGSYQGIGAYVDMANDQSSVVIVSPISGGPAEKVGIKGGDKIIKVDGESIIGMSLNEAINLIRGPEGSSVLLTIERLGEFDPLEIEVIRAKIEQDSVKKDLIPETNYAKIRINQYTESTPKELSLAIDEAISIDKSQGIILDLRNNPGGLLGSAVDATSLFIKSGVITFEIDANGKKTLWNVNGEVGKFSDIPMVTLVNANSASGSEVMAGALQDYGRSVVIGDKTYGKGSVSLVRSLSNGGGMFLTNAHWFTPNGRAIHDIGILPDVEISLPEAKSKDVDFYDTQVEAAIEQLNFEILN